MRSRLFRFITPGSRIASWAIAVWCGFMVGAGPSHDLIAQPKDVPVNLEDDERLQKEMSFKLTRPKIQEFLAMFTKETGVAVAVDPTITADQKIFGSMSAINVPAWKILEDLAEAQGKTARWDRDGKGYVLRGAANPAFVEKKKKDVRPSEPKVEIKKKAIPPPATKSDQAGEPEGLDWLLVLFAALFALWVATALFLAWYVWKIKKSNRSAVGTKGQARESRR